MPIIQSPYIGKPDYFKRLTGNVTGSNSTSAQPWFPSGGAVAVPAARLFKVEGKLYVTCGSNARVPSFALGGTATLTSNLLEALLVGAAANGQTTGQYTTLINQAAATDLAASNSATAQWIAVNGLIVTNAAGTLIPQFKWSADPGSTVTVIAGTYWMMWDLGPAGETTRGAWS